MTARRTSLPHAVAGDLVDRRADLVPGRHRAAPLAGETFVSEGVLDLRNAREAWLTFDFISNASEPIAIQIAIDETSPHVIGTIPPMTGLTTLSVDLSAFVGHVVQVRFLAGSQVDHLWDVRNLYALIRR